MTQITALTPANIKALRPELEAELKAFCERHGITAKVGNASYDAGFVKFGLTLEVAGRDEGAELYARYHASFDLPADGLGKTIAYGGKLAHIVGLAPSRKYPVVVTFNGSKVRKLIPAEPVAAVLRRPAPTA